MSVNIQQLCTLFADRFRREPVWGAKAPGRVNLIGEHIDYNGGRVLPAAIDREMVMLAAPATDGLFQLYSATYDETVTWKESTLQKQTAENRWANYFLAVLDQFHQRGINVPPLSVLLEGDIPPASGLSSSAAYEVCAATLFLSITGEKMDPIEVALLAQAAEHGSFVGVRCGIMDQFASACGVEGHALEIDCDSLRWKAVPLDCRKAVIVILHSTVRRGLVDSAYNERRKQCEEGLRLLNRLSGEQRRHLCDYSLDEFQRWEEVLEDPVRKRVRHVVTEQLRVERCVAAFETGRYEEAGRYLNASHESLRDDYEVSCAELDTLHEIANEVEGVFGCRMTGAGFGGCAVALVRPEQADDIRAKIQADFEEKIGRRPWTLSTPACGGSLAFQPRI